MNRIAIVTTFSLALTSIALSTFAGDLSNFTSVVSVYSVTAITLFTLWIGE